VRVQVIRQRLPGDNGRALAHQVLKQAVLERRELQHRAAEPHRLRRRVDAEGAERQHVSGGPQRAPQQGLEPRCQLRVFERLDQVVVGPGFQAHHFVLPAAARGEDQNGQGAAGLPQTLHDGQPIQLGQPQVNDDKIDRVLARQKQALFAVPGLVDPVPIGLQLAGQSEPQRGIVLDQ
jgi:hypothetical protein